MPRGVSMSDTALVSLCNQHSTGPLARKNRPSAQRPSIRVRVHYGPRHVSAPRHELFKLALVL
jgi:hypothetical protein